MLNNVDWPNIITGGFFGAIVSPILLVSIKIVWSWLPVGFKRRASYAYRRLILFKNPYWIQTNVTNGMKNILNYSASRIFIVRLGNLHMNNKIYSGRIYEMIEADHVWDWHFFLKNDLTGQHINGWIADFYKLDDKGNVIEIDENNSTTELGLIKRSSFKKDKDIIKLFAEYGLSNKFDDLIIYGVLKGVDSFPEISDLVENHLDKLYVEKITLFYEDGESTIEVLYEAQRMSRILIESITNLYNSDRKLYIDQEITDSDRERGLLIAKDILE